MASFTTVLPASYSTADDSRSSRSGGCRRFKSRRKRRRCRRRRRNRST